MGALSQARRLALLLCAALIPAGVAAQISPNADWRSLRTTHFYVHFTPPLEPLARRIAADAERAYAQLAQELYPPREMIDVVLSDDVDFSNGYATPFPTNQIVIYANPPVNESALRYTNDWGQLVITHELTHIFHLDRVRGVWALAQHIFGRAPTLFPNLYSPSWLKEGLAVYYESKLAGAGRIEGSEHRMIVRAAAIDHAFPSIGQPSLAAPRFPFGESAYAYGSLFIDYLARTRGEARVRTFIDKESADLIPVLIDIPARQGFGISFSRAWRDWRDSLLRETAGLDAQPRALRNLTSEGVLVGTPRWLDDTALIYGGTTGRDVYGAYRVDLSGNRRRIGRRNSESPNVPTASGLLYAQLDFVNPYQERSDLWIQRDRRETRLTSGARLTEPDVRADGEIVAEQITPGATRLVRVSRDGARVGPITSGSYDEQWTEPRWSHAGDRIAAVRWLRGDVSQIVVLDTLGAIQAVVSSGHSIEATPSWAPGDSAILYSSDRTGAAQVYAHVFTPIVSTNAGGSDFRLTNAAAGAFDPQAATHGGLAAVVFRADGYHLAVGPGGPGELVPAYLDSSPSRSTLPVVIDSGPVLRFSPWRLLVPRYWLPTLGPGLHDEYRVGFETSAQDAVGRHAYTAGLAVPTANTGVTGSFDYRYAGFGLPVLDVIGSQDWSLLGYIYNRDAAHSIAGEVRRRVRIGEVDATWLRPRERNSFTFTLGGAAEQRAHVTKPDGLLPFIDTTGAFGTEVFPEALAGASYANYKRPLSSIAPEDGVSVAVTTRDRIRSGVAASGGQSVSTVGTLSLYKSLDLPGFAHHVVALHGAGGFADSRADSYYDVGGTGGGTFEILPGYTVSEGAQTFGVRGFPPGTLIGTRAIVGSAEYRVPLSLSRRALGILPFFFDRTSLSFFGDAGSAWCATIQAGQEVCSDPALAQRITIASVGTELTMGAGLLSWDTPYAFRVGVVHPTLNGAYFGQPSVQVYATAGLSF